MTDFEARPLHLHTLQTLIVDLISARPVLLGDGSTFALTDAASRGALNWYRGRGSANWTSNVTSAVCEELIKATTKSAPVLPPLASAGANAAKRLTLTRVRAHRFAGIQKFGTPDASPADFVLDLDAQLTLFEGRNGSGKTSLVNAIIWALTGEVLRPQRGPEKGTIEFQCVVDSAEEEGEPSAHNLSVVTPLPDAATYRPTNPAIPVDTWVELTFKDESGTVLPPLRRTQSRNARGTLVETPPDLSSLGIDPIATRVGTVMAGLLPSIHVGKESELGQAVAQLTGLSALVDLSHHATRVKRRIDDDLTKARRDEITRADTAFRQAKTDLARGFAENPNIAPKIPTPEPSDDPAIEASLTEIVECLEATKAKAFGSARSILGQSFDPANAALRSDLEKNITLALDQVSQPQKLESFARLKKLASVPPEELAKARAKIREIQTEGSTLEKLARNPGTAARQRLYARVASWIADHPDPHRDQDACAVCGHALKDAVDPITGRPVKVHIHDAADNAGLLSQTLSQWASRAAGDLMRSLHENLRAELGSDLPAHPCDLLRTAIVGEMFQRPAFKGVLADLKGEVSARFDSVVAKKAPLESAATYSLPTGCEALAQTLSRLDKILRFAIWRRGNDALAREIFDIVLGAAPKDGRVPDSNTLTGRLLELDKTVRAAKPVSDALLQGARLKEQLRLRRSAEKALVDYASTSEALTHLVRLGELAEQQVAQLQKTLHNDATAWRAAIYLGAFPDTAQELAGTSSGSKGELGISVRSAGVSAPAQHVSNASALRASLVAFYLAFWAHVFKERGGLTLMLLDDPQELLDSENRERLAVAIGKLVASGARPIVTTYDARFAAPLSRLSGIGGVDHLVVHPATRQQPSLRVSPPLPVLVSRKEVYDRDRNAEGPAQDYADGCRVFLEATLGDLFDDPAHIGWSKANPNPTLSVFVARLRTLVRSNPQGMLSGLVFKRFVDHAALVDNSDVLRLMNKAHHGARSEIRAADVSVCADDLAELTGLADQMYEEAYRWRRRDSPPAGELLPIQITTIAPISVRRRSIIVYPDLAAFMTGGAEGESQETPEELHADVFKNKALFYLRRNHFGFAAPEGALALVETEPGPVADRRLVIAMHQGRILARRLLRPADMSLVALTSESPDPRKRTPQTVFAREEDVELRQVVGVMFSSPEIVGPGADEAIQLNAGQVFDGVEIAFRVVGESAVPLALEKQIVLGGKLIDLAALPEFEGALVALTLDDGANIFKRVSDSFPGALNGLRKFESIGGLGSSEVLAVGTSVDGFRQVTRARAILGVLYHG